MRVTLQAAEEASSKVDAVAAAKNSGAAAEEIQIPECHLMCLCHLDVLKNPVAKTVGLHRISLCLKFRGHVQTLF
eukprot:1576690-Amphidinium_carterae.1